MAAPKSLRSLTGNLFKLRTRSQGEKLRDAELAAAVVQLQNTVNELIDAHNTHVHTENTAASYAQNANTGVPTAAGLIDGAGAAQTNLFTAS